jgi:cytochrome b involved in lipid metabolism
MNKTFLFILIAILAVSGIFAASSWLNTSRNNTGYDNSTPVKTDSTQQTTQKDITKSELEKNNNDTSCWVSVKEKVYDVTPYLPKHPGGKAELLKNCGKELDPKSFKHPGGEFTSEKIQGILKPFAIGTLKN